MATAAPRVEAEEKRGRLRTGEAHFRRNRRQGKQIQRPSPDKVPKPIRLTFGRKAGGDKEKCPTRSRRAPPSAIALAQVAGLK